MSYLTVSFLALTWGQEEVNLGVEVNSPDPISADPNNNAIIFFIRAMMTGMPLISASLLALTWGQEEVNFAGEINSDSPASDLIPANPINNAIIFY
jgi:hypothetical protein